MRTKNFIKPSSPGVVAVLLALWTLFPAVTVAASLDGTEELKLLNGIPEGHMIIEGDIIVPIGYERATYAAALLWSNTHPAVIPFRFDTTGNDAVQEDATCPASGTCNRTFTISAMALWEAVADVDFQGCPSNDCAGGDFITIRDSSNDNAPSNSSAIGMAGGEQILNFTSWGNPSTMVHELGHALGYWHEQSRADRDTACNNHPCIIINEGNICQNCCADNAGDPGPCDHNFDVRVGTWGEYGSYDFGSLMHYAACDFSCCNATTNPCSGGPCTSGSATCRTITVTPPNDVQWQAQIGQGTDLSCWDMLGMSLIYAEEDFRFLDESCRCFAYDNQDVWCDDYGTFACPWIDFADAVEWTPCGGTLWIREPGNYCGTGTYTKPITIRAPKGGVTLGQ